MAECFVVQEIDLNREPDCSVSLGELKPSPDRTIFYKIPLPFDGPPKPHPERFIYSWDKTSSSWKLSTSLSSHLNPASTQATEFVSMPFDGDLGRGKDGDSLKSDSRWSFISESLSSTIVSNSEELIGLIKKCNPELKEAKFNVLRTFIDSALTLDERETFFSLTLPGMMSLAANLPKLIRQPIPILKQRTNQSLFFSQQQIASLLCNGFFSTFPVTQNIKLKHFTLAFIFSHPEGEKTRCSRKLEKLKCLNSYFQRVISKPPSGIVSFERRHLTESEIPKWFESDKKLTQMAVLKEGTIETDGYGMLQADFANRFVGGGVLRSGLVQEEIRFIINPELMASIIFTEVLLETETLLVTGSEQFSRYSGYGDTFQFDGSFMDTTPIDEWGRRCTKVIAMDATRFTANQVRQQYKRNLIDRELTKAYCAFMERRPLKAENRAAIATGNWGCGAFCGDPQLKSLIQYIAASLSEKDIVYFTFGNSNLSNEMTEIVQLLVKSNVTVAQLYSFLLDYGDYIAPLDPKKDAAEPLFRYIKRKFLS